MGKRNYRLGIEENNSESNDSEKPFFSVISVCYKDVWALSKTARSVFRQKFSDFEYLVVDGDSKDGTKQLVDFWNKQGLVSKAVIEPDRGVYDAMNKALKHATGQYTCFMNAGDVFYADDVLARVYDYLTSNSVDGVLGWGELRSQLWASWIESPAFKMASLGFCHQSLYVKTDLLRQFPFDSRPSKTDSDTLQLGSMYASGARIPIVAEPLAKRGGEPGISADLEKTQASIVDTLTSQYSNLDNASAETIIRFRRRAEEPQSILTLLDEHSDSELRRDLAKTVLDTLFLRQSKPLASEDVRRLFLRAKRLLESTEEGVSSDWPWRLETTQKSRLAQLRKNRAATDALRKKIHQFELEETSRLSKLNQISTRRPRTDYVISMTSFPPRLSTLHLVIQTLIEQSCPPSRIQLWLGQDEVPSKKWLSKKLLAFEDRGLEVMFCEKTCLQYDKFLHNAELNQDKKFIIVDDDVIYPPDSMQALLEYSERFPDCVVGNRCHEIGIGDDGKVLPYNNWHREVLFDEPSHRVFPTGAGGVLYPAGFFGQSEVTNINQICRVAPYADDIWLKIHSILQGRKAISTPLSQKSRWYHRYTPTMTEGSLHATNVDLGLNDRQIRAAVEWLGREGIVLDALLGDELATCR